MPCSQSDAEKLRTCAETYANTLGVTFTPNFSDFYIQMYQYYGKGGAASYAPFCKYYDNITILIKYNQNCLKPIGSHRKNQWPIFNWFSHWLKMVAFAKLIKTADIVGFNSIYSFLLFHNSLVWEAIFLPLAKLLKLGLNVVQSHLKQSLSMKFN